MKTNFNPQRVTIHGNHPDLSWYDNCREAYYKDRYERNMLRECIVATRAIKNKHNKACTLFAAKAQAATYPENWAYWDNWTLACAAWEKARDTVYELQDELAALKPRTEPSWSPPLFTWGPRIRKRPARGACARAALREQLEAEPTDHEVRYWEVHAAYLTKSIMLLEADREELVNWARHYEQEKDEESAWMFYQRIFRCKLHMDMVRYRLDRLLLVGP